MGKKRIALIFEGQFAPSRDGGSTTMLELLLFLKKQGSEVYLFNFITKDLYDSRYLFEYFLNCEESKNIIVKDNIRSAVLNGVNIYQEILPYRRAEIYKDNQKIIKLIIRKFTENKIDYVYTCDDSFITLLSVDLLGIPGAHFFNSYDNVKSFTRTNPIYARILKKRTVFAVSKFIQIKLKELLAVDVIIWHPAINFSRYAVNGKTTKVKAIGFFSGGIPYHKGDEIVNNIIKKTPQRHFIIVGTKHFSQFKQIPDNMEFLGHRADMKRFYEQIGLLLVPSITEEGFARVVLEAAINGIPVIANRVGGIPEALGNSGILIDIDLQKELNFDEIANKYIFEINRLLNNEAEYAIYSKKALLRAEEYEAQQEKMGTYIYENYIQ